MGENLIIKLTEAFGQEEQPRILELVGIFEKAIDTINNQITTQLTKSNNTTVGGALGPFGRGTEQDFSNEYNNMINDQNAQQDEDQLSYLNEGMQNGSFFNEMIADDK